MPLMNVVVDGSNIATEGRSAPSLDQLDQAVRQYLEENPDAQVTVVVDASFGHRIDPKERSAFDEAVSHGELISPPAGAIGRGDAFLLRIAERIGAKVLSNDSFREFHGEHPWLFDEDRLVGGTPVPGVGWIFSPRRPVRGPATDGAKPRRSKSDSPRKKAGEKAEAKPERKKRKPRGGPSGVQDAIAQATVEALGPEESAPKKGSQKRKQDAAPDAVNDPLSFITFASEHPIGSQFEGTVVSFTSHGAMAQVGDMLCYVPLAGLGVPPPTRARDVLKQGDTRTFELVALDPSRRGAQLALPEVVASTGLIAETAEEAASEVRSKRKKAPSVPSESVVTHAIETAGLSPVKSAAKVAKRAKATKAARATKATKVAKAGNAAKSKKVAQAAKATKATKAAKANKSAKKAPAKASKATKATKATNATNATKATKPAKSAKSAKRVPAKAAKRPKAAKAATKSVARR
jgi:Zc3h12a-like Ribonuclease NYN domain